jgi:hypothetical protein
MSDQEHDGWVSAETAPAPETVNSIDKVRDILFGSQTKSNEARFARLEDGLAREVYDLKETMRRRFESVETFFRAETEALASRIRAEREERMSVFAAHDREMQDGLNGLARRLGDLDSAMNEGDSALRKDLMSESRKLVDEMGHRHETMRGLMESRVTELRSQKADRALISDLMREMATQLDKEDGATPE